MEERTSTNGMGGGDFPNASGTHSQGGLYSAETMASFHTEEIYLLHQQGQQAGQGEMADTHATLLLVGGRGGKKWSDRVQWRKQSWAAFLFV